jgi:hypothetical protein
MKENMLTLKVAIINGPYRFRIFCKLFALKIVGGLEKGYI